MGWELAVQLLENAHTCWGCPPVPLPRPTGLSHVNHLHWNPCGLRSLKVQTAFILSVYDDMGHRSKSSIWVRISTPPLSWLCGFR